MSSLGIIFTIVSASLLGFLPRRFAALTLVLSVFWVPRSQILAVGALSFSLVRILIAVGIARVVLRGEWTRIALSRLDRIVLFWAGWAFVVAFLHELTLAYLGDVYTACGLYFLLRIFIHDRADLQLLFKAICWIALPVAIAMLAEKAYSTNYYAQSWGETAAVMFRHGHFRARGPFAHPILAGTVGASCLPLAIALWQTAPVTAILGVAASISIVFASASSGPLLMALAVVGAMASWPLRCHLRLLRWLMLLLLASLSFVMHDPVYFLIARLDVAEGSTGWYRAKLIQSAIEHFNEWWIIGTDRTRHWMAWGWGGFATKADITNYYIEMGVRGGVLLMLLFLAIVYVAFTVVGSRLREPTRDATQWNRFGIWILGSALLGHALNFVSVSYFDPCPVLLFYLVLAAISTLEPRSLSTQCKRGIARVPFDAPLKRTPPYIRSGGRLPT